MVNGLIDMQSDRELAPPNETPGCPGVPRACQASFSRRAFPRERTGGLNKPRSHTRTERKTCHGHGRSDVGTTEDRAACARARTEPNQVINQWGLGRQPMGEVGGSAGASPGGWRRTRRTRWLHAQSSRRVDTRTARHPTGTVATGTAVLYRSIVATIGGDRDGAGQYHAVRQGS